MPAFPVSGSLKYEGMEILLLLLIFLLNQGPFPECNKYDFMANLEYIKQMETLKKPLKRFLVS